MNTPSEFDDEWSAQERARRAEQRHASESADDARVRQYRLIARVLRQPALDPLPRDFARRTAARIESLATVADERLEVWLIRGLVVLFGIVGGIAILSFAPDWWRALVPSTQQLVALGSSAAAQWCVVIVVCLGLSSAVDRLRKEPGHR